MTRVPLLLLALLGLALGDGCDPLVSACAVDEPLDDYAPTHTPTTPVIAQGYVGCDGQTYALAADAPRWDACGVCSGDGSTCCDSGRCSGHGLCSNSRCVCDHGWAGPICTARSDTCANTQCDHGSCDATDGNCNCDVGWTGTHCHIRMCAPHGAYDKHQDACVCAPGWTGEKCRDCADAGFGMRYVCEAPGKMVKYLRVNARVALELGTVWLPGQPHNSVLYSCDCRPLQEVENAEARALNVIQLEDAFNELSLVSINRLTSTQQDLDRAVRKTQQRSDEATAQAGIAAFCGVGTMIAAIFLVCGMVYVANAFFGGKRKRK